MTEQQYINARNISDIKHAENALREICIDNQPRIDKSEFVAVLQTLARWQSDLTDAIEINQDSE